MPIPIYQVDAFTDRPFSGNPAAVCPLEKWLPDEQMQAIAAENNLAETAFFVREDGHFALRWFTPCLEIDLCGHATLASAYVVLHELEPAREDVRFATRSGELIVRRDGDRLALDFPSRPPAAVSPPREFSRALGAEPLEVLASRDYLAVFDSEEDVRALDPDMGLLKALGRSVIVTAPGSDVDFVSRFFAPDKGIPEDPVTGSAHCTLIPWWSARLGRKQLRARQISPRGGELWCEDRGARVSIAGHAVLFLRGSICVEAA